MQRRPRLVLIKDINALNNPLVKDRITGEILDLRKTRQRLEDGLYSTYQVHQLNLLPDAELRLPAC